MTYVVTQPCCNDATCVPVCPVNCIHPTPDEPDYASAEMLYIDPDSCIDCGACVDVCPVDAIVPDYDLTDENARFADINALYFADPAKKSYSSAPYEPANPKVQVNDLRPLRVAIVGSGPAACYAAEELLTRRDLPPVEVHMLERLPTPWGLVRFGVAPDHQDTKSVTKLFSRTVARAGLDLHLNVEIGEHITHDELLAHHHAVIYAVGAKSDRRLGIPGEDLPGSHSATDFVAWYNGHPEFADRTFDLSGERAVIVGNGNVALDVARVLATDVDQLRHTDIADHALEALASSRISEVVVLGRRGPAQAAYTVPELLGLAGTPGIGVVVDPKDATLDELTAAALAAEPHSMAGLKARIAEELSEGEPASATSRVLLRYLVSPVEVLGDDRVCGLRVTRNELVSSGNGRLDARATDYTEDIDCGLVLRSIGYRGTPVPGLPFDEARGTLPNEQGRVVDAGTGAQPTGVYTAGWIKRGPSGVIGTNKKCAADTVHALLDDYASGRLTAPEHGGDALRALIAQRQPDALGLPDWKALDRHERAAAQANRRSRIKLVSVPEMLRVAKDARSTAG